MMPTFRWLFTLLLAAILNGGCVTPLERQILPPRVWLKELRLMPEQGPGQRYLATLRIQNPNPMALPGRGLSLELTLAHETLARAVSNASIRLAELGEVYRELEIVAQRSERLTGLMQGLESGTQALPYRLEGEIFMANDIAPLQFFTDGILGEGPLPAFSEPGPTHLQGD